MHMHTQKKKRIIVRSINKKKWNQPNRNDVIAVEQHVVDDFFGRHMIKQTAIMKIPVVGVLQLLYVWWRFFFVCVPIYETQTPQPHIFSSA